MKKLDIGARKVAPTFDRAAIVTHVGRLLCTSARRGQGGLPVPFHWATSC